MVAVALIVALCLGGGVSFVAENALPGDALYVVKTDVNENVRAALAVSTEAEARWQAQVAERRLKEAGKLATKGTLTADTSARLSAEFSEHAEAALLGARMLAEEGKSEASAEITAKLEGAVSLYGALFAKASGSAAAGGEAFVLPHVLEKSDIRVSSDTSAMTVESDNSGTVEVRVGPSGVKSETSVHAEGSAEAEATSKTKMEGSTNVDISF